MPAPGNPAYAPWKKQLETALAAQSDDAMLIGHGRQRGRAGHGGGAGGEGRAGARGVPDADKLEKVKREVKGRSRSSRATSRIRPWWRGRGGLKAWGRSSEPWLLSLLLT